MGNNQDDICIYYHTSYCMRRGHTYYHSSDCAMKTKTKEEQEAAKKVIGSEDIKKELQWAAKNCGKLR